jgi:hypothetical protein
VIDAHQGRDVALFVDRSVRLRASLAPGIGRRVGAGREHGTQRLVEFRNEDVDHRGFRRQIEFGCFAKAQGVAPFVGRVDLALPPRTKVNRGSSAAWWRLTGLFSMGRHSIRADEADLVQVPPSATRGVMLPAPLLAIDTLEADIGGAAG